MKYTHHAQLGRGSGSGSGGAATQNASNVARPLCRLLAVVSGKCIEEDLHLKATAHDAAPAPLPGLESGLDVS